MKSDYFTKDQRNEKKNLNSKTNFIAQGGDYEVSPKKFEYGAQPAKGNNDFSNVKAMITDLKGHHFTVGKESIPAMRSNEVIGSGASAAKKPEKAPWAHQHTNFELGRDKGYMNRTTDGRFGHGRAQSQSNPFEEMRRNKAKIEGDDIRIAGNNFQHGSVSSHMAYPDKFNASKSVNRGLDKHMASNIKGSHFTTGYNNTFSDVSEAKANMAKKLGMSTNRLSPERIDFFKSTHH